MNDLLSRIKAFATTKGGRATIAGLLAVLATFGVTITVIEDGPDHHEVTVKLGGPGQKSIELTPSAQRVLETQKAQDAAGDVQDAHSDLKAEPLASHAPDVLQQNDAQKPAGQPTLPANPPLATVHQPGCRTLPVRNYSSRNGAPILIAVTHFTVSTDNGWAGVLGNVRWFDSLAAQASSNYIIDRRIGACAYTVAESQKAWAQAGFNPWAVSVEVTARGTEGSLVTGPGKARLIQLYRHWHDAYGIPYRHGKVSGCRVVRTGFVIHKDLGACGGGHVDTAPYSIDPLIREAAAGSVAPKTVRRWCHQVNVTRARIRKHQATAGQRGLARKRKALARKRGYVCGPKGPVKA